MNIGYNYNNASTAAIMVLRISIPMIQTTRIRITAGALVLLGSLFRIALVMAKATRLDQIKRVISFQPSEDCKHINKHDAYYPEGEHQHA